MFRCGYQAKLEGFWITGWWSVVGLLLGRGGLAVAAVVSFALSCASSEESDDGECD